MADEFNISEVLNTLKRLFQGRSVPSVTQNSNQGSGFQAPLKGEWRNSGNYSPGIATDKRHPTGHFGIDMRAPGGTAVYPMAPGTVTNVGLDPKGGNVVNIDHGNGIKTYYAHLGTIRVHKGDKVSNDTVIGTVGDTGNAKGTTPHVHFQVWRDGQLQNPGNFFSVPKYTNLNLKVEKQWLPGAKEEAMAWSMKDHVQQKRMAFSQDCRTLNKVASEFYKLCCK